MGVFVFICLVYLLVFKKWVIFLIGNWRLVLVEWDMDLEVLDFLWFLGVVLGEFMVVKGFYVFLFVKIYWGFIL